MSQSEGISASFRVDTSSKFERAAKRFFRRRPDLRARFLSVRNALAIDPFAPALRTHALFGDLKGQWSCSLDYANRITMMIDLQQRVITLEDIGSHDQVYRGGDDD